MNDVIIRYRKAVSDPAIDNRSKMILFEMLQVEKKRLAHIVEIINESYGPAEAKSFEKELQDVNKALALPWTINCN
jgi:hypothetical protein